MSDALVRLVGPAAPLLQTDINTDTIAPMSRTGSGGAAPAGVPTQETLAQRLFGPWRYRPDGSENPDFALNRPQFRQAKFILGGPNFACGSSRETAATMLKAFGIRCVIAPSFGLIFHDNCFRNHMLPLTLDWDIVQRLGEQAGDGAAFALDLQACTLVPPDGTAIRFSIPAFRRDALLAGADEVAMTLRREVEIAGYQHAARQSRPWEILAPATRA